MYKNNLSFLEHLKNMMKGGGAQTRMLYYLSISFKNLSYAGKCSRCPVGAVKVSKVNLPLTRSVTIGTNDPSHTNASSPTSGSSFTCQHEL